MQLCAGSRIPVSRTLVLSDTESGVNTICQRRSKSTELPPVKEFLGQFGGRLPAEIQAQLGALESKLG